MYARLEYMETAMLALGMLALLYAALISAGAIDREDVNLSPALERKRTMIAFGGELSGEKSVLRPLEQKNIKRL